MIHKFQQKDLYIVLDIYSGAVHIVDEVAYALADLTPLPSIETLLQTFPQFTKEQIAEACEELNALVAAGMLHTEDDSKAILPKMAARAPVVKALCLHVAHDCNLKCHYCFAEEGEYHGKREMMTFDVGKTALDFLIANSGSRYNLEVDFFGGEPLMNFEVVKELVHYGHTLEKQHRKKFRFTMTTNGLLLDEEKLNFINQHMHNLVLSLDGRREINDRMRPVANGTGSYDILLPKLIRAANSRKQADYFVRGTFTRYNMDFAEDVLHLADLGFQQISVEPVVAEPTLPYAIQEEDLPGLYAEYDRLADALFEKKQNGEKVHFFHFQIDLTGGPCVMKRLAGCGSGTEYLAVTPTGDLYPCHQFVGMPEFRMGSVFSGMNAPALHAEFSDCHVYNKPKCRDCWAKFYCSGGCAANAYQYDGSLLGCYDIGCALQKKRVECAIALQARNQLVNI